MRGLSTAKCILAVASFYGLIAVESAAVASDWTTAQQGTGVDPALPPFEFRRVGAASPEQAAETLFRAIATESPKHFVQHLLLEVCDGPIATLQKFAESLHRTEFRQGEKSFTVYSLPERIDGRKPIRMIASRDFDGETKQVAALELESVSTYWGKKFKSVDVAGESYDGLEYRTRIVVAQVNGGWYAIPRCRSSKSFYEIADAMPQHLEPK